MSSALKWQPSSLRTDFASEHPGFLFNLSAGLFFVFQLMITITLQCRLITRKFVVL